ncbi:uncharacterized protein [Eleutherodactylus coqui]|uniref:RNA/RNP complex-1-interacting phosphatase n=1 Tax=Eleutherodactylus coqui TaxID=57060 RepID=A0A8J6FAI6_ELECQ|nr:hypothetical protein GDO78_008090 [Eleutherodactylus coqui]
MVKKNSIPDRWRSLTAVGQRVPGSRFIAFKVPLKGVTNQRVTQNQKFTPKDLISAIRSQNEELGLIVDLTNTERYYTTKDLPKSVQYVKLHTAGLKIPDDATIHQFKRVAWKFLAANSDNDKLIGVHCTTGINRSGYLICRYLIDVDGWRPLHALCSFSQARGHPIEGTVYIEDIVKGAPRSNVGIDLPPTIDEIRDLENRSSNDDLSRGRGQRDDTIKSLLELIPGNEYADFDARDRRPLPLMRARSDEYQDDDRLFFNLRSAFRGRLPLGDMSDDVDLRSPMERRSFPSNMPERMNAPERFRRPVDFNPDGRFSSGLENRQDFHGSEPRPLMDIRDNYGPRDMQRPRGMQQEQMGYDDRMRGQQSPVQGFHEYDESLSYNMPSEEMNDDEYDDLEAESRMRSSNSGLDFKERLRRQELQSMESENQRFNPREREMIHSLKGLITERMHSRSVRTLEGPMNDRINARNTQFVNEPMNETINQRDRRGMEGPIHERMQSRDARFTEGSVNERFPQGIRNLMHPQEVRTMSGPMNERIQSRDAQFMEGPVNNQMNYRDPRQMEASTNERMQPRVARLMDLPLTDRLNPREEQAMGNSMNDRLPQRALNRPEMMTSRDARSMEGPMSARMHPRIDRAVEGTGNDQMHSREGFMNERMSLRDTRPMEGLMNERMYQRDVRSMQGSMNEQTSTYARPMEGSMNESMYSHDTEYSMNQQRDFVNDNRSFEGRKMNASEDLVRGTNRFAPYPSLMKPAQPAEIARRPPQPEGRDMFPPSQEASRFPPRNRFN